MKSLFYLLKKVICNIFFLYLTIEVFENIKIDISRLLRFYPGI